MTVKELIDRLETYKDLDLEVCINDTFRDIFSVSLYENRVTINTDPYFTMDDYWNLECRSTSWQDFNIPEPDGDEDDD